MKQILLGTVFGLALAATPSFAADMPVKAPRPAPAFSWTGFYIGAHGGGGWGQFDTVTNDFFFDGSPQGTDTVSQTAGGFMAGGQIGANFQVNNVVVGIEADIAWSSIKAKTEDDGVSSGTQVDWFGTIRGRIGYTWDTLLLYGTGGAAYGRVKMFGHNWSLGGDSSYSDVLWGWTAGAGVEWAFARNWSIKGEYLYVDLGSLSKDHFFDYGDGYYGNQMSDVKFHTLKLGLNYRF